jgi:uncharacterized protein YjgD (DUF1641 family)
MARPIPFDAPKRDARLELQHRLDRAPAEHAAALLDACELLQALHDRKVLDTLRGLVGSGETVLDIAVQGANSPTSIHAMRNMLLLFNMIGSIDPDTLKKFTEPLPQAIQVESLRARAPGLWGLLKSSIFDKDFRRGLAATIGIIRSIGLGLDKSRADTPSEKKQATRPE